ncbi:MAG: ABC transporter ATP-binding protein [Thermaerobacter sp.]|nr:ABC transporter ATP-binding protein [Thermaerobacter sp.]
MGRLFQLTAYYLALGVVLNVLFYVVGLWERSLQNRILNTLTTDLLAAYYRTDYRTVLAKGEGYFVARVYRDTFEWISVIPSIRRMVSSVVMTIVFLGTGPDCRYAYSCLCVAGVWQKNRSGHGQRAGRGGSGPRGAESLPSSVQDCESWDTS